MLLRWRLFRSSDQPGLGWFPLPTCDGITSPPAAEARLCSTTVLLNCCKQRRAALLYRADSDSQICTPAGPVAAAGFGRLVSSCPGGLQPAARSVGHCCFCDWSRSVSRVRLWRAAATSGKRSPAAAQGGGSSRKQVRLDERRVGKEFVISIYEISDACIIIFDVFIADGFSQWWSSS